MPHFTIDILLFHPNAIFLTSYFVRVLDKLHIVLPSIPGQTPRCATPSRIPCLKLNGEGKSQVCNQQHLKQEPWVEMTTLWKIWPRRTQIKALECEVFPS